MAQRLDELIQVRNEPARAVALAGGSGLRPLSVGQEWLESVLRPDGRGYTPQQHLRDVRRFPNPQRPGRALRDKGREPYSHLDAGDILQRLGELTSNGQLATLLLSASDLLGTAVRDREILSSFLCRLPPYDSYHRNGATVALAALGRVVPPEYAIASAEDCRGLEAYAVAPGIAPMRPATRRATLEALRQTSAPSLWERLDELAYRAGEGETIAIAM